MELSHGQMNESTERWKIIQNIIRNNKIKTILEIGTWKGYGSTLAILKSMNEDSNFTSIESNLEFFKIAKQNLKEYENKFNLLYGRIIEISDVKDFVLNLNLDYQQNQWLNEDLNNFEKCPNVLNEIPNKIDFLLLDGGEFSTYSEWKKLEGRCKFIALDDINVLKCNKIHSELSDDKNYEMVNISNEGNGFSIFKKIN